jgi:hypothetical protein
MMVLPPGEPMIITVPDESEYVRSAGFGGKIIHFVVEQHAGPRGHIAVAEEQIHRDGDGRAVSRGVEHGEMRGVHALWLRLDSRQEVGGHGPVGANAAALARCVVDTHQLLERHLDEIRITQENRAVAIGTAHGLDDEMLARGGIHVLQIEPGKDIERIQHRDAAR